MHNKTGFGLNVKFKTIMSNLNTFSRIKLIILVSHRIYSYFDDKFCQNFNKIIFHCSIHQNMF